ncbi:hypothetical protein GUJ93_ZPchr0006g41351 [Zizania palustris]|uniref:Uncharacterized protein n=1 Tax=Zizania palustris TaxID=103762 RepID=A0A8J5T7D1_ZIZPA|nr:hypothetical protein GUJ93_ZPchr0006g41351 [Zizania palustris]KAG8076946.1 hypothetical protein GUJ93_ZPchr0006g41351 [Zizania palustris]
MRQSVSTLLASAIMLFLAMFFTVPEQLQDVETLDDSRPARGALGDSKRPSYLREFVEAPVGRKYFIFQKSRTLPC